MQMSKDTLVDRQAIYINPTRYLKFIISDFMVKSIFVCQSKYYVIIYLCIHLNFA